MIMRKLRDDMYIKVEFIELRHIKHMFRKES